METNVNSVPVSVTVSVTVSKTQRLRPAVQNRKAVVLDALKTLLSDGVPRGPSDIARELNTGGLTDLGVWNDAYHLLKSSGIFGCTFIEGGKRAKYFIPLPVSEVVVEQEVAPLTELNSELADLVTVFEEVAPVVTKKNKNKKAA